MPDKELNGAAGVTGSTVSYQETGAGSIPSAALQVPAFGPKDLLVKPVPSIVARRHCEEKHYLHSYPGGALLNFGIFCGNSLMGVVVLSAGPTNIHRLFRDASRQDVACLARLWLDDRLGRNSESRTLGIILRQLRKEQTTIKALVAYSDPMAGHTGVIYQASGFLYLGESTVMPLYKLADGSIHHSRSLSHRYGTHSRKYFQLYGVDLELVEQEPKYTYVAMVEPSWRARLTRSVLPYPRKEQILGDS